MEIAKVNGVRLEYEVVGSGEPVLLISPVLADGFLPLLSERALAHPHQLIRYHKRGWVGSTHTPAPASPPRCNHPTTQRPSTASPPTPAGRSKE